MIESTASNSFQEEQAKLALLGASGWSKVLAVSDPPHMLRLDWVWGNIFVGLSKSYVLVASAPAWWDATFWRGNEKAGQFVVMELSKMGYYAVKYSFW